MTYDEAREQMRTGANVRREVWITTIKMEGDALVWNLSAAVLQSCAYGSKNIDPYYRATATDKTAADWEVVG